MIIETWLKQATVQLKEAGIETARLDCFVLLEDILQRDRAWFLAYPEHVISTTDLRKLEILLSKRSTHEPLAYIRGRAEFYGRTFIVSPDVLVPRPETETMIDQLLNLMDDLKQTHTLPPNGTSWRIADVGTGCGAIGITVALELPKTSVSLVDISPQALAIAEVNVISFATTTPVVLSDLLANSQETSDILLCNLPYVPDEYKINIAAQHEPKLAIFGGSDGLDLYRKLFDQIDNLDFRPLYILTEALPLSHNLLSALALQSGYEVVKTDDFIQLFELKTTNTNS